METSLGEVNRTQARRMALSEAFSHGHLAENGDALLDGWNGRKGMSGTDCP
jgi:hypothetical protein